MRTFLIARVARIYPAYLFALILALPLFVFFSIRTLPPDKALVKVGLVGLAELLVVQAWVPLTMSGANPPGWSLSVEAFLYLAFPTIGMLLMKRSRAGLFRAIGAFWIVALVPPVLHAVFSPPPLNSLLLRWLQPTDPIWNLIFANPLLHLAQFSCGVGAGILYLRGMRLTRSLLGATAAELAILAGVVVVFLVTSAGWLTEAMLNVGFLAILYVPLILILAEGRGLLARALSHPGLVLLGGASYGIYILQAPVRGWTQLLGRRVFGMEWSAPLFTAYVALLIGLSIAVFYAEERVRPALKDWLTRKTARRSLTPARASAV